MIDAMSRKLAVKIKQSIPDHPASVEVLRYALATVFLLVGTLALAVATAAILGQIGAALLALASFGLLRILSGGRHLSSSIGCIVISAGAANIIPYVHMSDSVTLAVTLVSVILAYFFAPSNLKRTSRIPPKFYPALKYVSMLLIATNLFFLSDVTALCFFIQCLLLIGMGGDRT